MDELTHRRRWGILAVLSGCLLIPVLDTMILQVALQRIQAELGATQSELQWAVDAYTLVFAALLLTTGALADAVGRKRILLLGLLAFGIASALCAFAASPGELVLFRAVKGIGAAAVPATSLAILTTVFPAEERARAIGIFSGVSGLGVALGPVVGGLLLEHFWWGSVFLVNVPVVLAGLVLVGWLVPESRSARRRPLDPLGALLSIGGIGLLVYAIIHGGEAGDWLGAGVLLPLGGAVALLALFVLAERRTSDPAVDLGLFRSPVFTAGSCAVAIGFFVQSGGFFALVFYLQLLRGNSPLETGLLFLPVAVGTVLGSTRGAALSRRFGPNAVVGGGLAVSGLFFAGSACWAASTPVWLLELLFGVFGLAFGCVLGPATAAAMSVVPPERVAAGSAVSSAVRQIGAALGIAVVGSVLSVGYRSSLGGAAGLLPEPLRERAADSLGATLAVREQAGARAGELGEAAFAAFLDGMAAAVWTAAAAALLGAVLAAVLLPGRVPARAGTGVPG
ncbi:DHA2 family efflux MFS transporter permease subunit [Crossiella sp. CA-258035]|uniref:DHA2 family efflux MFS transporter permease subunit n=1 Tax=Crossiella sp. CA-258035 TaxID=2981138 RepID=UPI0024BD0368|nr:DHA2 family efflux MFS transporter permease subunit [Crossiella sp. CA-258035]WHT19080.1 DHA2 family efflux MFS transporter permease subunit [Crossiella sp. CA-258035]